MEEWTKDEFRDLLTSNIWNSNYENIKEKLHLDCWKNPLYEHLLTPTIFSIKSEQITRNIEIFEYYKIENFITKSSIRINSEILVTLIEYLIENEISLVVDDKLNPILNTCEKRKLKERYGIDIKHLMERRNKKNVR